MIETNPAWTEIAWRGGSLECRQLSLEGKPAKKRTLQNADPGSVCIADFHGELHQTRNEFCRVVRHVAGEVLDSQFFAQVIGRG